jgi:hypothetical protein
MIKAVKSRCMMWPLLCFHSSVPNRIWAVVWKKVLAF